MFVTVIDDNNRDLKNIYRQNFQSLKSNNIRGHFLAKK